MVNSFQHTAIRANFLALQPASKRLVEAAKAA
jgi:hypothetical protein